MLLFGERLRSRRTTMGFTQEYVSNEAGISLRYYQMIERGEKNVSLDTLIRLSKTLHLSTDYLLFGDLSCTLENPMNTILSNLSPQHREDALKILQLYANACQK